MKRIVLYLLMVVPACLSFPSIAKAQNVPDDEGEVITITIDENSLINGPKRTPLLVPITAVYFEMLSNVDVSFAYNIGDVTVTLTNLVSGSSVVTIVDSSAGNTVIPVTLGTGLYRIEFCTEDGVGYVGYFIY